MSRRTGWRSEGGGGRSEDAVVKVALGLVVLAGLAGAVGPAAAEDDFQAVPVCELDRPIVLAALDWDSSAFHNAVASYIFQHGYGCQTDSVAGSTIPLLNRMSRGQIDVTMEMWIPNVEEAWTPAVARCAVMSVGINLPAAPQAWLVPI